MAEVTYSVYNPIELITALPSAGATAPMRVSAVNILKATKLGVNVCNLDKTGLQRICLTEEDDDVLPDLEVPMRVINRGVAFLKSSYASGNINHYPIYYNRPVCVDLTNIRNVTGLNPDWTPEEFLIVGIALKPNITGDGVTRGIPVRLVEHPYDVYRDRPFTLLGNLVSGGSALAEYDFDGYNGTFTVYDHHYGNIVGASGDTGFAQSINGKWNIKTLTCSAN